jgi:hypothetical protein
MMTRLNEIPGALAGATGADQAQQNTVTEYYYTSLSPSMALCLAIVKCDPHDAWLIMERAMSDMVFGQPLPVQFTAMSDANWWADWASPVELKAYALACYRRMPTKDQRAFLAYVGGAQ